LVGLQFGATFFSNSSGHPAYQHRNPVKNPTSKNPTDINPTLHLLGPMLRFKKIYFRRKIWRKNGDFFARKKAKLFKNWIIRLVFEKNANFFSRNWQKSQEIVIITSTPCQCGGAPLFNREFIFFGFFRVSASTVKPSSFSFKNGDASPPGLPECMFSNQKFKFG
jgi:hypothetical protein